MYAISLIVTEYFAFSPQERILLSCSFFCFSWYTGGRGWGQLENGIDLFSLRARVWCYPSYSVLEAGTRQPDWQFRPFTCQLPAHLAVPAHPASRFQKEVEAGERPPWVEVSTLQNPVWLTNPCSIWQSWVQKWCRNRLSASQPLWKEGRALSCLVLYTLSFNLWFDTVLLGELRQVSPPSPHPCHIENSITILDQSILRVEVAASWEKLIASIFVIPGTGQPSWWM